MSIVELIGVAASLSLLAGWRLYASVLAAGIAMRTGLIDLPQHLAALGTLASPWVIGAAGVGFVAEFFADKIAWLDSVWDGIHTAVRPIGGALLALAVVDAGDPVWQVVAILLGGGAALASHSAKAGGRAIVNTSPEPFSNIAVSVTEDVLTLGGLALTFVDPVLAAIVAASLLAVTLLLIYFSWRILKRIYVSLKRPA
jgi:hypothetical protein